MSRILVLLLPVFICTAARSPFVETKNEFFADSAIPKDLQWLFNFQKDSGEESPKPAVCDSDECELIAKIMKASMNESVDPCDDFYEYACGMWPQNEMIPDSDVPYSLWSFVARDLTNRTEDILEREPTRDDALPLKLARKFYKTCMDVDGIEKAGLEPFLATISRIGGWPLIMETDEWSEEDFSWQKVDDYYARLVGYNAFYEVASDLVSQESMEFIAVIADPRFPLDSWVLLDEDDEDDDDDIDVPTSVEVPGDSMDPDSVETVPKGNADDEDESDEESDDESDDETDENKDDDDSNMGSSSEEPDKDRTKCKNRRKIKKHKSANDDKKKRSNHRKVKQLESDEPEDDSDEEKRKKVTHKRSKNTGMKHKKVSVRSKSSKSKDKAIKYGTKHKNNNMKVHRVKRSEIKMSEGPNKIQKAYGNLITEVALAFSEARGDEISRERIEKDVEDLVQFIMDVQGKMIFTMSDDPFKNMTIDEWQEVYDSLGFNTSNAHINWYDKLSNLLNEANVEIKSSTVIRVPVEEYLKKLPPLLAKTPSRTIVNYIHWNFLSKLLFTSTKKMRTLYYDWNEDEAERTVETLERRDRRCSNIIDDTDVIGYEYVRKYFTDDVRKTASDMVEHIQAAVKEKVENSEWLNDWGKNFVLEKLQNMKKIVGFPDWYSNKTAVNRYFGGLVVGPTFFENVLNYWRYKTWRDLRYISTQTIDVGSVVNPLMLNAFYIPQFNTLAVTAADLQNPLFGARRPATLNYGIIGAVLGHEVNHGFDGEGRKYDKSGKVTQWLSAMVQEYSKRAECFVDQYENYANQLDPSGLFEGYGNQTRDENIADTMGLEACYNALKKAEKENGAMESTLPGFEDFNTDQMFFLSYANLWCGSRKSKELSFMALFDTHSTAPLRVRGSLSNMEAFGKAFNCPVGSTMNPEKKCNIWN